VSDSFEPIGPPDNELGVAVPLRLEVGRTEDLAFGVLDAVAFSTGFSFTFTIWSRVPQDPRGYVFWPFGRGGMTSDTLRFSIRFADGGQSTMILDPVSGQATMALDPNWPAAPSETAPRLINNGVASRPRSWSTGMWVSPLPPPGPVAFSCDWEAESVAEVRREIDAQVILEAAAQVEQLWRE
jgi:hypothetical protein